MKDRKRVSGLFDVGKPERAERPANAIDAVCPPRAKPGGLGEGRADLFLRDNRQMSEIEACRIQHRAAFKFDDFKAATAKIGDKPRCLGNVQGQAARHEMRLLDLRQHLDGLADDGLGRTGEFGPVAGAADRRRRHSMDRGHPHRRHDPRKPRQRRQRHLDAVRLQHVILAKPLAKPAVGSLVEQRERIAPAAGIDHKPD